MHVYQKIQCKKLQFLEDYLLYRCTVCFQNKQIYKLVNVKRVNIDRTESAILKTGTIIVTG